MVQSTGTALGREDELERRLREHHATHYPDDGLQIAWRTVPAGAMLNSRSAADHRRD